MDLSLSRAMEKLSIQVPLRRRRRRRKKRALQLRLKTRASVIENFSKSFANKHPNAKPGTSVLYAAPSRIYCRQTTFTEAVLNYIVWSPNLLSSKCLNMI